MTRQEIARYRLHTQRLASPPLGTPAGVVGWLGAMQAQEHVVAKWSVGQRAAGVREAAVDRALADGTILRTHLLRPTWHFVLPADVRWMTALTGPRVHAVNASWYRKFGVDDALAARSRALLAGALANGRHLTREGVAALLAAHGIAAAGLRLGYLLMRAELDLVVCSGAPEGKHHTYALFDERVPGAPPLPRDEALAELTRRYFASRGPATVRDFVWWSGLTVADAKRGLAAAGPHLERLTTGDRTYWVAPPPSGPPSPAGPADPEPAAHLLQGYDEYVIAYRESKDVFNAAGLAGRVPAGGTPFTHAVVVDGQVAGHWRRLPRARAITIEVQPVRVLAAAERDALDDAVARYGRFVGMTARWREVPPAGHPGGA